MSDQTLTPLLPIEVYQVSDDGSVKLVKAYMEWGSAVDDCDFFVEHEPYCYGVLDTTSGKWELIAGRHVPGEHVDSLRISILARLVAGDMAADPEGKGESGVRGVAPLNDESGAGS